jgi:hypothetical protein
MTHAIMWLIETEFGLRTALPHLDASLWLATQDHHELIAVTDLTLVLGTVLADPHSGERRIHPGLPDRSILAHA